MTKMAPGISKATRQRLHEHLWLDHTLIDQHLAEHSTGGFLLGKGALKLLLGEDAFFNQHLADADALCRIGSLRRRHRKLLTAVFTSSKCSNIGLTPVSV